MSGRVIAQRDGAVLTLTLSNPGKANAIDLEMLAELEAQVAAVQADPSVRAVLLRGTPGGTFSAGADVRQWAPMPPATFAQDWIARGNAVFHRFEALRCPSVALIEGACFGGGLELALCADLRVGSGAARLRFPELGIGAIPGWEGGHRLARLAGRGRALEAVLTARTLDADTAAAWGVLNAVWPAAELDARLAALLGELTRVSPHAAAIAKAVLRSDEDPLTLYPRAAHDARASPDAETGLRAFFDKRTAVF